MADGQYATSGCGRHQSEGECTLNQRAHLQSDLILLQNFVPPPSKVTVPNEVTVPNGGPAIIAVAA